MESATPLRRLMAYLLDAALFFLTLIVGYIIWWLIALRRGQTPGKQLLGIRAMHRNGEPAGWLITFVRSREERGPRIRPNRVFSRCNTPCDRCDGAPVVSGQSGRYGGSA